MKVERRDIARPNQAPFVVVRLGDHRKDAGDADAVRPHRDGDELSVLVENLETESLREETAKLEDVTQFHSAGELDRAGAVWCRVTRLNLGDLDRSVRDEVAAGDEAEHVPAILVGASDPVRAFRNTRIGEKADACCRDGRGFRGRGFCCSTFLLRE